MAKLTIRNDSANKLKIDTGAGLVEVDAGAQAELTEPQLLSSGFTKVLDAGAVSFAAVAQPTAEQSATARKVLAPRIAAAADRASKSSKQFTQAQANLLKLRDGFNKAWKAASASLDAAQKSNPGWKAVKDAAQNLVFAAVQDSAEVTAAKSKVTLAQQAVDDLKGEDLAQTNKPLEQWYTERVAADEALAKAQADLAALVAKAADPLIARVDSTGQTVADLAALNKDQAIGKELPAFGL